MITITKDTYIPSVDETLGILRRHNSMMPQFFDYDKIHTYLAHCLMEAEKIRGPLFEFLKILPSDEGSVESIFKSWLVRNGFGNAFDKTKDGISLSKNSVAKAVTSGLLSDEAKLILTAYQKHSNYKKSARTMMGLLQHPVCNAVSYDGHRMIIVVPTWAAQNTGRVAMRDPAVQNFPREFQDLATVPKGWTILHTDSGQIEPRVIYSVFIPDPQIQALIRLYNDAYFGVLHYVTMPSNLILSGTTDFIKMELTDDMKAMRKEIKTHQNAVMYGSTSNASNSKVKAALIERIGKHPMRQKWLMENDRILATGTTIFKTAFGTPIDISKSQKLTSDMSDNEEAYELVKLAINNPIQGTAADLMRVSVDEANHLLGRYAKRSYILNYVHDAGTFAIHDDDYDKVADKLADIVSYNVEGWLPITAEPHFGREAGWFEDYI